MPGGDRAYIDPAKIAGYLLNPQHRTGRNNARVFASALDLRAEDAGVLLTALVDAAAMLDADSQEVDGYGARYAIQFTMTHAGRSATVRSLWIIRTGEDFPRFVTAYVANREASDG